MVSLIPCLVKALFIARYNTLKLSSWTNLEFSVYIVNPLNPHGIKLEILIYCPHTIQ